MISQRILNQTLTVFLGSCVMSYGLGLAPVKAAEQMNQFVNTTQTERQQAEAPEALEIHLSAAALLASVPSSLSTTPSLSDIDRGLDLSVAQTIDSLTRSEREVLYAQQKMDVLGAGFQNLTPFTPASFAQKDWGWAVTLSALDAALIGFWGYTLLTSGLSAFSGDWALLGVMAYAVVPFVGIRTLAVLRAIDVAGRHNAELRSRLQLDETTLSARPSVLATPQWNYRWDF